ncbi:MAG TPA: twin-arginine translocation signal domain-containing protein, partial [Candidatus Acidoferrum sp.]|nr:twin-arginine translocation signal domain-containing protein [Candidatus Acidoferrum sp.]
MERRAFLKGAGIVTVLVAGGGVWRAWDQGVFSVGQGPAYEPWKNWRSTSDGPLGLVRAAILAASPHNTQPWLFKVTSSSIELYVDTARNTGALDPFLREQRIGLGCALENLMLAAQANSYQAVLTLMPGKLTGTSPAPQPQPVARVELTAGTAQQSELYNAIPRRHTNRNPYDPNRPLIGDFVEKMRAVTSDEPDVKMFLFTDEKDRKKIAEIISQANDVLYADPAVAQGSEEWIRFRWKSVQKYRDGLTVDAFGLSPGQAAMAKMVPASVVRRQFASAKNLYLNLLLTAPMFGVIAVRDRYDQQQSLRAGRIWQRTHLFATARGV